VINFTVPPNTGAERTGSIIVAGQRAAVIQSAAPPPVNCSSAISPTSQNIAATGGPGVPIGVSIPATCSWSAQSNVPWITVTSGATGTGSGTVTFHRRRQHRLSPYWNDHCRGPHLHGDAGGRCRACLHLFDLADESKRPCHGNHRNGNRRVHCSPQHRRCAQRNADDCRSDVHGEPGRGCRTSQPLNRGQRP
jgi:hypothetical protein